jgi:hypothetical protein
MLGADPVLDLPEPHDVFLQYHPAMGIEWRDPQADSQIVSLVAQLLELVAPGFPECAELDLYPLLFDNTVRVRVTGSSHIEPSGREPAGNELLTNRADLS